MPTGHLAFFERFDLLRQALSERHATAPDADEGKIIQAAASFQHLMREAHQCPIDFGRTHQLTLLAC